MDKDLLKQEYQRLQTGQTCIVSLDSITMKTASMEALLWSPVKRAFAWSIENDMEMDRIDLGVPVEKRGLKPGGHGTEGGDN